MVNKKLSNEDENNIYMAYVSGQSLSEISKDYPVVVSTIQRVVKRKSYNDKTQKNFSVGNASRHIKNSNIPLEMAITLLEKNDDPVHEIQKEYLLESLQKLSMNLDKIVKLVQNISF